MSWTDALNKKQRRGSLPRCLRLVDGDPDDVARRLTDLVALHEVHVAPDDVWMPEGLPVQRTDGTWDVAPTREAKLGEAAGLLDDAHRQALTEWWLAVPRRANTPNWDIASTCTIEGKKGLLLVEAKAHANEIKEYGKALSATASENSRKNHERIRLCIDGACADLTSATGLDWSITSESHYQLANRFAWSWKLTELGVPVVLVYLGFLNAGEMRDVGEPFADGAAWETQVRVHAAGRVPDEVWNKTIRVNAQPFTALIRSFDVPLAG